MPAEGFRTVTLKEEWVRAIDELRVQDIPPPSRTQIIYAALATYLEERGVEPPED